MTPEEQPPPDPLSILDALEQFREMMRGVVASYVADGFTDAQARALAVYNVTNHREELE